MFKIVSIVDKGGTALDRLARGVIPYHTNFDYKVIRCHPKRPSPEELAIVERECQTADIIDAQYYRTMDMLRERFSWLKKIPTVLTHNNPYAIHERDWNDYQVVIGNNKEIYGKLKEITTSRVEHIPLVVDPYFWTFNEEYKYPFSVIMVANRIEAKKGILPVAKACKQLNCQMYLVGAISDPDYWKEVMDTGVVQFAQQIKDEELRDLYHKSGIHVCNSVDNFESGTLPILEAIFCGVPVLSRNVGHVPDIKSGKNIVIQDSNPDDVEHIAQLLSEMFGDKKLLDSMRNEAWMSIKDRNFERRAYAYQKLYRELWSPEKPVSVIVPIAEKPEITSKCVNAVLNQSYKNMEIIVIDDGEHDQKETVESLQKISSIPFRYFRLGGEGYNLAKARNIGAIESTSDILVFCDQRMIMDKDCVKEFVANVKPHQWLYGNKGAKKDFLENLSCLLREDFMTFGMFNERITAYGGMSQECRARARRQGFNTQYVDTAKAIAEGKSHNRSRRKMEILEMKNLLWKCQLQ